LQGERLQLEAAGVEDSHQCPAQSVQAVDGEAHQGGGDHDLFGVGGQQAHHIGGAGLFGIQTLRPGLGPVVGAAGRSGVQREAVQAPLPLILGGFGVDALQRQVKAVWREAEAVGLAVPVLVQLVRGDAVRSEQLGQVVETAGAAEVAQQDGRKRGEVVVHGLIAVKNRGQ